MTLLAWGKNLQVGVPEIDVQHMQFVQMVNELHDAIRDGHSIDFLDKRLNDLVLYTLSHFENEERMMRERAYPDAKRHLLEHEQLRRAVQDLQKRLAQGNGMLAIDVMRLLKDWLTQHLVGSDKTFASWLVAQEAASEHKTAA